MQISDEALERNIRELLSDARIPVEVVVRHHVARLFGPVDSIRLREAAIDLASAVDGVVRVDDDMSYEVISPDMVTEPPDEDEQFGYADEGSFRDDMPDAEDDFAAPVGTPDDIGVIEEGETYFPPVDPVVEPARSGRGLEIVGGFQSEATDDTEEVGGVAFDESVSVNNETRLIERDDDEMREDVLRALQEDSETTSLVLDVDVLRGVVYLRGNVQSIDDAENAESVASRVPGVVRVEDRTNVR